MKRLQRMLAQLIAVLMISSTLPFNVLADELDSSSASDSNAAHSESTAESSTSSNHDADSDSTSGDSDTEHNNASSDDGSADNSDAQNSSDDSTGGTDVSDNGSTETSADSESGAGSSTPDDTNGSSADAADTESQDVDTAENYNTGAEDTAEEAVNETPAEDAENEDTVSAADDADSETAEEDTAQEDTTQEDAENAAQEENPSETIAQEGEIEEEIAEEKQEEVTVSVPVVETAPEEPELPMLRNGMVVLPFLAQDMLQNVIDIDDMQANYAMQMTRSTAKNENTQATRIYYVLDENTIVKQDTTDTAISLWTTSNGNFAAEPEKDGYTFAGWSENQDAQQAAFSLYETVRVASGSQYVLYPQWEEQGMHYQDVGYYIRTQKGFVPHETGSTQYNTGLYSARIPGKAVRKALYNDKIPAAEYIDKKAVDWLKEQLKDTTYKNLSPLENGGPSAAEIKKVIDFDPSTQEVIWYVVKETSGNSEADRWHVDGTIIDKDARYSVTYYKNDKTGGGDSIGEFIYAEDSTVYVGKYQKTDGTWVKLNTPTRDGYTFEGWYTTPDCKDNEKAPETITLDGHKKYYAKWTFTVSYNENKDDSFTTDRNEEIIEIDSGYQAGTTAKIGTLKDQTPMPTPTREGYKFVGWTDENRQIVTEATSNMTVFAKWEKEENPTPPNPEDKTFTVRYNENLDDNFKEDESDKITADEGYTVGKDTAKIGTLKDGAAVKEPNREGYVFKGWVDADGNLATGKDVTGDTTVFAKWEKKSESGDKTFTVRYNENLDDNFKEDESDKITADEGYTVGKDTAKIGTLKDGAAVKEPTRDGYVFKGWVDADGNLVTGKDVTGDTTVFAKWEKKSESGDKTFTVRYNENLDDNFKEDESDKITADEGYTVGKDTAKIGTLKDGTTVKEPTRDGYRFVGWVATNGNTITDDITADTTVFAKWEKNNNGGNGGTSHSGGSGGPSGVGASTTTKKDNTVTIDDDETPRNDVPITIDDEDVPLDNAPAEQPPLVEIIDAETPLADLPPVPAIPDTTVTITPEDIPLAALPKTGDTQQHKTDALGFAALALAAFFGSILFRKGKHNK